MENSEFNKDFHFKLNTEFQKIDEALGQFRDEVRFVLFMELKDYIPGIKLDEKLNEVALLYANQLFSSADAVIDKDNNYSTVRLQDELEGMNKVVAKFPADDQRAAFAELSHRKMKELVVNHFSKVIDLSANGFRLLERYCQMHNNEFMSGLSKLLNQE